MDNKKKTPDIVEGEITEEKKELVLQDNISAQLQTLDPERPKKEIAYAASCAKALIEVVNQKPKKVVINEKQYLEFEDWQTIARFYNITVGCKSTKRMSKDNKFFGFEAKAEIYNQQGITISSAEAQCTRDEKIWGTKPEFQLRSMAQTRASAKALRNVLAWVVVLAGYKTTPAEEMSDTTNTVKTPQIAPKSQKSASQQPPKDYCSNCETNAYKIVEITEAETKFSKDKYGRKLCRQCQQAQKGIQQ